MSESEDRTEDVTVPGDTPQTPTEAVTPVEVVDDAAVEPEAPRVDTEIAEIPVEVEAEVVAADVPGVPPGDAAVAATPAATLAGRFLSNKWQFNVLAAVVVIALLLAVVYALEKQDRINTSIFDGVNKMLAMKKTVATVNDASISQYDLDVSVSQIAAGAELQGLDVQDPAVKSEITNQAIDMLVNTELLKQEAVAREIFITDEEVNARFETLKTDVGGEEVLKERMAQFNIDSKTLLRDIKNELTIQTLLDQVFAEKGISVTDADIKAFYDQAGGAEAGLPPLEEVTEQIAAQLKITKEQEVVTNFVKELRDKATVDVLL